MANKYPEIDGVQVLSADFSWQMFSAQRRRIDRCYSVAKLALILAAVAVVLVLIR